MAEIYTGITVYGLYNDQTGNSAIQTVGSTAPTEALLLGGKDSVSGNIYAFSVDNTGKLNVNASISPPSDNIATGTINGDGSGTQTLAISVEGTSALMVQVTVAGGYNGTLQFEASLDDATWQAFKLYPAIPNGSPAVTSTTGAGNFTAPVGGIRQFRVRNVAGTTGTVTIFLTSGQGQYGVFNYSDNYANFLVTSKVTDGTNTATVTAANALKVDGSAVTQPVSGTVTANQGGAPWTVKPDGTAWTQTGTSADVNVTNTVTVTGTVAATQSGTWTIDSITNPVTVTGSVSVSNFPATQNVNLTQVGGSAVALGQTTMSASIPVAIASDQSAIPVTLTSTTITGTVAVTQSTTPWVTKDQADGATGAAVPAQTMQVGGSDGTNLRTLKTSTTGTLVTIPADEALAASLSYYSYDSGAAYKSLTSASVPLWSIQSNSAAITFLLRGIQCFTDGSVVLFQLVKNAQTLTGASFVTTGIPTGSHVKVDTTATAVTIGTGTVVWSGYVGSTPRSFDGLIDAMAAGTPGDTYTVVANRFGTGTAKATAQIRWSEQTGAL